MNETKLKNIDVKKILFFDIETVPQKSSFSELDETWKVLWKIKCKSLLKKDKSEEVTEIEAQDKYSEAGIYSEFGKIACISVGVITQIDNCFGFKLKSFSNFDESILLREFSKLLNDKFSDSTNSILCGHNIKEFDVPYIARRMIINHIDLPNLLEIYGKKPWELSYLLDTMELWKFGDYKSYTSLKLLAAVFGIPSPKDDIDGSQVGAVFWKEKDLSRIVKYCQKDVLTTAQIFLKYINSDPINTNQIEYVE